MPTDIPYWAALVYGLLAAAMILLGGGLVGQTRSLGEPWRNALAALGAGFLIALGLLGALPEAIEQAHATALPLTLTLAAIGVMLLVHRAGHGHGGVSHGHAHAGHPDHAHAEASEQSAPELSAYDTRLAIAGLTLHALLDGVAVGASLASHRELGLLVALCVLLHKVPEGATAAALTYAGGGETRSARRNVAIIAAASLLGSLAIFAVGPTLTYALAIAAGVTSGVGLGIASHLLRRDAGKALVGMSVGAVIFALSEWLMHR
jgi:zinc transporter ZupT